MNWDEVEELAAQIAETPDPVRRVLLRADWRRASDPATYLPDLEADFIAFAGQWAQASRVTGDDFFYEGVPLQVLRESGLGISEEARAYADDDESLLDEDQDLEVVSVGTSSDGPPASSAPSGSAPGEPLFEQGSTMEKVYEAIGDQPFTINDLVDRSDASRSTVRAVLDKLEESGRLKELQPLDTGSAGRSPKRYQLSD